MSKTAVITGASGMGLAVAKLLSSSGNWSLHLLDMNEAAGQQAVSEVPQSTFHKVDVTSYESLSSTFKKVFQTTGQLDFVFANAGIVEKDNFYARHDDIGADPPPAPNMLSLTINLNAVISTTYIAMHYFRLSPHKGKGGRLVMNSSCGGLVSESGITFKDPTNIAQYPSEYCPIYSASKAGVINFMRAISFPLNHDDGVHAHAICPGTVRTNLQSSDQWANFPAEYFTPIEKIASTVVMLVNGGDLQDSKGRKVPAGKDFGLTVEITGENHYFRDQPEYCDEKMASLMVATSMASQAKNFPK
jgi:NAD(P)-dependent dehydrogenase (short-subunit alcohol dehydrogenase family)